MVRKAFTRKRQTNVAGKKKLVARRGFRGARTDSIRPAADSINEQPSR
jgi:hypothetical protein